MSLNVASVAASAAFAAALFCAGCSGAQQPRPAPAATLSAHNKAVAYAVGLRLAEQDRARQAEQRAAMARLIDVRVKGARDGADAFEFLLALHNKSAKPIARVGLGLEVRDTRGRRIGLTELDDIAMPLRAHASAAKWHAVDYARFGSDAGTMRLAQGRPKIAFVKVIEIRYADGSDAGYDD